MIETANKASEDQVGFAPLPCHRIAWGRGVGLASPFNWMVQGEQRCQTVRMSLHELKTAWTEGTGTKRCLHQLE